MQSTINLSENIKKRKIMKACLLKLYSWCGPCKKLGPKLEDLAKKAEGKWKLVKINADDITDLVEAYNVEGIPALFLFYNKEIVESKRFGTKYA